MPKSKTKETASPTPKVLYYKEDSLAKKIMWLGVIIFVIGIAAVWGWSFRLKMARLSKINFTEKGLAAEAKKNWEEIFSEIKSATADAGLAEQKLTTINQIKNILRNVISASSQAKTEK